MRHFVPNYLIHRLKKNWAIVSVGCGTGVDVEVLRDMGFDAYGFDPGRYEHFSSRKPEVQEALRVGTAEDMPFGPDRFDYAYALEVIEHVGCRNFGIEKLPDAESKRIEFLRACLSMIRPGGMLFVATSNKDFIVDVGGHPHRHSGFGMWIWKMFGISISIPWSRGNPLVSYSELKRLAHAAMPNSRLKFVTATGKNYARASMEKGWKGALTRALFAMIDTPLLRTSPLSPLLAVEIHRES